MGAFDFLRRKKIQAHNTDGQVSNAELSSDFWANYDSGKNIGGTANIYKTYSSQVRAICDKYKNKADCGNQIIRAVIDMRTAFICSEGISIAVQGNPELETFIRLFMERNKLNGSRFVSMVKGTEMYGRQLYSVPPSRGEIPFAIRHPENYRCQGDAGLGLLTKLMVKAPGQDEYREIRPSGFIIIATGGDGYDLSEPTPKAALCLDDSDNYDRAIKDMRLNNHICARITPVIETETDAQTGSAAKQIKNRRWRIGKTWIGKGFRYETPKTGAAENLKIEAEMSIMNISAVSGLPVHWLGHTPLMSNRSTAETLYVSIINATAMERLALQEGIKRMIIKAQKVYIDSGGLGLPGVSDEFQVRIPVMDYKNFKDLIQGIDLALVAGIISMDDARNMVPGIDPIQTERALKKENGTMPTNDEMREGREDG